MKQAIEIGCPLLLTQPWQMWLFLLLPCFLSAITARIFQGSFLRIVGACLGAGLRDSLLLFLISRGLLIPNNEHYDFYAGALLLFFTAAGGSVGATLAPNRGILLMVLAAAGTLVGQWSYGYLPLAVAVAVVVGWGKRRPLAGLPTP